MINYQKLTKTKINYRSKLSKLSNNIVLTVLAILETYFIEHC